MNVGTVPGTAVLSSGRVTELGSAALIAERGIAVGLVDCKEKEKEVAAVATGGGVAAAEDAPDTVEAAGADEAPDETAA